jgi:hypothetical protein
MFCGGLFVTKPATNEFFICSDGIEMGQKELLQILRAVLSLLQGQNLKTQYRVLYVEAASTLIQSHRGCIFGVCTYQPMSIPLLASLMDRMTSAAVPIWGQTADIDISNQPARSAFLGAMRALISDSPAAVIPREVRQAFNTRLDMAVNIGSSNPMQPKASGNFRTTANADAPTGDESGTETSTPIEMFPTSESPVSSERGHGTLAMVRISQEVSFRVRNHALEDVGCTTELWLAAGNDPLQKVPFSLLPNASVGSPRVLSGGVFQTQVKKKQPPFDLQCGFSQVEKGRVWRRYNRSISDGEDTFRNKPNWTGKPIL